MSQDTMFNGLFNGLVVLSLIAVIYVVYNWMRDNQKVTSSDYFTLYSNGHLLLTTLDDSYVFMDDQCYTRDDVCESFDYSVNESYNAKLTRWLQQEGSAEVVEPKVVAVYSLEAKVSHTEGDNGRKAILKLGTILANGKDKVITVKVPYKNLEQDKVKCHA